MAPPARGQPSEAVAQREQEGTQVRGAAARRFVNAAHVEPLVGVSHEIAKAGGAREPVGERGIDHASIREPCKCVGVGGRRAEALANA